MAILNKISPIRIVSAADEGYIVPLGVMLCSLFENNKTRDPIEVYLLTGEKGISDAGKSSLKKIIDRFPNTSIHYLHISSEIYKVFNVNIEYINLVTYYRFSIDSLFDESIERILYLDCDLIIKGDIKHLWHTDLKGKTIGAVEDGAMMKPLTDWAKNLKLKLRLEKEIPYLNAGVLLIDMVKWRAGNISEKCIRVLTDYPEKITLNDQDALNFVLRNNWYQLPIHWNTTTFLYTDRHRYANKEIHNAVKNPSIIHYTTGNKPWYTHLTHPAKSDFLQYWDSSPWYPYSLRTDIDKILKGVSLISVCITSTHLKKAIESWLEAKSVNEIILVYAKDATEILKIVDEADSQKIISVIVGSVDVELIPSLLNLAVRMSSFDKILNVDCGTQVYPDFVKRHPLSQMKFYCFRYWEDWFHNTSFLTTGFLMYRTDYLHMNGLNEFVGAYESNLDLYQRMLGNNFEEEPIDSSYLFPIEPEIPIDSFNPVSGIISKTIQEKMFLKNVMIKILCKRFPWQLTNQMQEFSLVAESPKIYIATRGEKRAVSQVKKSLIEKMETEALKAYFIQVLSKNFRNKTFLEKISEANSATLKSFYHFLNEPHNALLLSSFNMNGELGIISTNLIDSKILDEIYKSMSWRIGFRITRLFTKLMRWSPWFKKRFPDG